MNKVEEYQRMAFLPWLAGKNFAQFEMNVFALASRFIQGYDGAFWDFYIVPGDSGFMAFNTPETVTITIDTNGYSGSMSAQAAGIVLTLFGLNLCMEEDADNELLVTRFYGLRDFASKHPEAAAIFAAID